MDKRPIGIFDSGVGGLTVAREVMKLLPEEKIVYFGDLARLPYGSKSKENVIKFSEQIIRFLLTKDVKAIIIACGTASSNALDTVVEKFDIPIMGVVKAGAKVASAKTKKQSVGIIGTEGTVSSGAYQELIQDHKADCEVHQKACPLFVPLVEEGWVEDHVTREVVARYLAPLKEEGVDTLVLGCTHYPLLTKVIGEYMGDEVSLVNPGEETAKQLKELLNSRQMHSLSNDGVHHEFYVSDSTDKFEALAKRILDRPMLPVEKIEIEDF